MLIRGESGTGKEIVAAAIQQLSARSDRPFETVNCGALTKDLLLSELFGHERGAFTGAIVRKRGLLTTATGGTLFYDRLRHVVLDVPALRDRRGDIALLVEHFRARFNQRYGLSVSGVTAEALAVLESHEWRGNVRELEAVIEQAMIFQDGEVLRPEDLALSLPKPTTPGLRAVERRGGHGPGARLHLTPHREIALRIARARGAVTRRELANQCCISGESARQELLALMRLGHLRRAGQGRSTRYVLP